MRQLRKVYKLKKYIQHKNKTSNILQKILLDSFQYASWDFPRRSSCDFSQICKTNISEISTNACPRISSGLIHEFSARVPPGIFADVPPVNSLSNFCEFTLVSPRVYAWFSIGVRQDISRGTYFEVSAEISLGVSSGTSLRILLPFLVLVCLSELNLSWDSS